MPLVLKGKPETYVMVHSNGDATMTAWACNADGFRKHRILFVEHETEHQAIEAAREFNEPTVYRRRL